jgi:transglutaminase-like putative cysteine protease
VRYKVRHATRYAYGEPVDLGSHMLHLSPRELPGQHVHAARIVADPAPARINRATDHFGNTVTWLFFDQLHSAFEVVVDADVEVAFAKPPDAAATPPWDAVAAQVRNGGTAWEAAEFVFDSPMAPVEEGTAAYAAESFAPGRPALEGLLDLNARIARDFLFRSGVTTVSTPVSRVLAQRAGVCQDFTHLMISGLRGMGIPARYVSGYLHTRPPSGRPAHLGADHSHAWVGAWLGPVHGWIGLDPTNNLVVRDEHVVLAWGRDHADVSPVRGVILGGGRHTLEVAVRLEETGSEAARPTDLVQPGG